MLGLAALLLAGSSTISAAVGECPSAEALAGLLVSLETPGRIEVRAVGEALEVRLLADSGAVLGEKRIPRGDDCAERTRAIGILVSAWTVDLRRASPPVVATATAAEGGEGEAEARVRIPTPSPLEAGLSIGSALTTSAFYKAALWARAFVAYDVLPFLAVELAGAWLTWGNSDVDTLMTRQTGAFGWSTSVPELRWMIGPALRLSFAEGIGATELIHHARVYLIGGAALGGVMVQCLQGQPIDPDLFGAGAICPESPPGADPFDPVYEPMRFVVAAQLGGGLRIAIGPFIAATIELRAVIYHVRIIRPSATDPSQADRSVLMTPVFVSGGLSWLGG